MYINVLKLEIKLKSLDQCGLGQRYSVSNVLNRLEQRLSLIKVFNLLA